MDTSTLAPPTGGVSCGKPVVVIGFAACYKTSVGALLAKKLNYPFVDTDAEIESICNKSVQQIFDACGQAYFRKMESELLQTLKVNAVISCGGGSVLADGFDEFARGSTVVCLTASAQTVHSRLGAVARPLFDGLSVEELNTYIQQRKPLYDKYADITVSTDGQTPEQVAEQVYAILVQSN